MSPKEFREIYQSQISLTKNSEEIAEYKRKKEDWQSILHKSEAKLKNLADVTIEGDQKIKKIPGAWPPTMIVLQYK